ncbi:hypothetical protein BJF78_17800 [Pseudonocardia sp. CNS-139]|nr:hypothetical protein BJF78_17800 [Pseudonocardia sp. CNS-139]
MDVVVQQVAEGRDGAAGLDVVVGAEERGQVRLGLERGLDPGERVGVHLDVGVDEDEHVTGGAAGAGVAGVAGGEVGGTVDEHDLVDVARAVERGQAPGQRRGAVGRRHDHGEGGHRGGP